MQVRGIYEQNCFAEASGRAGAGRPVRVSDERRRMPFDLAPRCGGTMNYCALNCALTSAALCTLLCTQKGPTVHSLLENCALNCALTSAANFFLFRKLGECTVDSCAGFARPSRSLAVVSVLKATVFIREAVGVDVLRKKPRAAIRRSQASQIFLSRQKP